MTAPTFADLGVPEFICSALAKRDITTPFEIQAATLTDAMAGRDVCGRAPTGSGKTLAFGIPLVAQVERAEPKRPRALVLAPTRELAEQICTELRSFSGKIRIGVVYGGVGYGAQFRSLNQGVEILVACPGRLEDLIEQGAVALNKVDRVVLDEADRMADMGFMPAVRRLLDQTSPNRQTVLFSATLDGDVAKLTKRYQDNPVRHEVGDETPDITSARHIFWNAERTDRVAITADAVLAVWPAIVFCRTRRGCDRLSKQLERSGVKAAPIHGGRSQGQRTRALDSFAKGKVDALVATDVAARGIHVDGVALVVHYDPPEDHKTYVHRSGRTARAGQGGIVVSLIQAEQAKDARRMQRKIDLDEPFTDPDANSLRDPSAPPSRVRTQKPDDERDDTRPRGEDRQHRSNGQKRRRNGSGGSGSKPKSKSGGSKQGGSKQGGNAKNRGKAGAKNTGENQGGPKRKGGKGPKGSGGKQQGPKQGSGKGRRQGRTGESSTSGRPNRKARRAHLQTGTR